MARSKKNARHGKQRNKRTKEEWEAMKKANPALEKQADYKLPEKTNANFERFYRGIGIVPEDEWLDFLQAMMKPLPTTFRITGSRSQAHELLKIIKGQYLSKLTDAFVGGVKIDPHSLPWYPDEMAWQLDFSRKEIRDDETLKSLHGFLVSETESGNISRQEAVSMLPPLLMDIKPHHKILDMCAAPGSKTAQLIEMLHSNYEVPEPEGFVVANDMDNKRCYLMTHQVKRIQSPNCMIINHDARILPNMVTSKDNDRQMLKYDRVLCDVPCSGDGTMRKNPDIWAKWHVNGAYNLHRIQKKVLQRGLELLAVGGKLVYSTCSLNPIEDEAVIFTLIQQCAGAIELLDVSDNLQGLKYCKGTYSWKVMVKNGTFYETVDEAPDYFQKLWDSTMYPPKLTEAQDAKLDRCVRVLPQQQNTGAFFIAVLTKTKELPWISARSQGAGPVINPKLKLDPSEQKDGAHFSFGVRSKSGLYLYGRCDICNVLLQSKTDFDTHKVGRKHKQSLELEAEKLLRKSQKMGAGVAQSSTKTEGDSAKTDITENDNKPESDSTENTTDIKSDGDGEPPPKKMKIDDSLSENVTEKAPEQDSTTKNGAEKELQPDSTNENGAEKATQPDDNQSTTTQQQSVTPMEQGQSGKAANQSTNDNGDGAIKVKLKGYREDPFYFCSKGDPIWPKIREFYNISDDFSVERLMYRNMKRVMYYVSEPIRNLVLCNDERVKFINLGVKCLSNAPSPLVPDCDYRISQEGIQCVYRKIQGRRIHITRDDIVTMLSEENPFICKFSNRAQEELNQLCPGSSVFLFSPTESDPEPNVDIVFCGWRGKTSVRSFVSKDEKVHYLRMCGVEYSPPKESKSPKDGESTMETESPNGGPNCAEGATEGGEGNVTKEEPKGDNMTNKETKDEIEVPKGNTSGENTDVMETGDGAVE